MINYCKWGKLITYLLMCLWAVFVIFRIVNYFTSTQLNQKELLLGSFAILVHIVIGNIFIFIVPKIIIKSQYFFTKDKGTKLSSQKLWLKGSMWLLITLWAAIVAIRSFYYLVNAEIKQFDLVIGSLALLLHLLVGSSVIFIIYIFVNSGLAILNKNKTH